MRRALASLALSLGAIACAGADAEPAREGADSGVSVPTCEAPQVLELAPWLPDGTDEAYVCYAFDVRDATAALGSIVWRPPGAGGIGLHHAVLSASPHDVAAGPALCDGMLTDATPLHVWAPGGDAFVMPAGVGLGLPGDARRFVVEAHLLRVTDEPVSVARAELCPAPEPIEQRAAWFAATAPVPAIRPHMTEHSAVECVVHQPLRLVFTWPHMHRLGRGFVGEIVRADARREPLVSITEWSFDAQQLYPIDVELAPDDAVATACTWVNPTSTYALPGPLTSNEMCNQGLIAWPAENVGCTTR